MAERDQTKWRGIRPVDPAESIPVESKDGDKLFAFESIVEEPVDDYDLAAGNVTIQGGPVPADKIWKIAHVAARVTSSSVTSFSVAAMGLAGSLTMHHVLSPTSNLWTMWNGELYMQEGDYFKMYIYDATLNDNAQLHYAGVQMNVP